MRFRDILRLALSAMYQQRVRALLTLAGVVLGTLTLAVSLSLGRGFEHAILGQLSRGSQLRQVWVDSGTGVKEDAIPKKELEVKGKMSEAKKRRIRQALIHRRKRPAEMPLSHQRVEELARLPHVDTVTPFL